MTTTSISTDKLLGQALILIDIAGEIEGNFPLLANRLRNMARANAASANTFSPIYNACNVEHTDAFCCEWDHDTPCPPDQGCDECNAALNVGNSGPMDGA